jgi:hypothetical protein
VITGGLGVIVVVLESMQGLFQFQQNWTYYRSTAEGLKHEKFLWQARAGPYKDLHRAREVGHVPGTGGKTTEDNKELKFKTFA